MWVRVDSGPARASAGVPEPGMLADGELAHDRPLWRLGQRVEHRVADAALGPVILDRDEAPVAAGPSRSVATSMGFTLYRSTTRALTPSPASRALPRPPREA